MAIVMHVWRQLKPLKERRNGVQAKYIELNKKKQRDGGTLSGDDATKWTEVEAELADLNSRVTALEEILDDGTPDADADQQRTDDPGQGTQGTDQQRSRQQLPTGLTQQPDGTILLPDGRQAVLLGQDGNNRRSVPVPQRGTPATQQTNGARVDTQRQRRSSREYREGTQSYLMGNRFSHRAIQQDVDVVGGYLIAPMSLQTTIMKAVDNRVWMRQLGTKITVVNGQSAGQPTLDTNPADSDWTAEIGTVQEESDMTFGRRELKPSVNTKLIKVSKKALDNAVATGFLTANDDSADKSFSGVEGLISNRFGYKFGVTAEKAYLTGNGINKPLGIFTASNRGISTARDYQTGSATNITYAGLLAAKYALKSGYDGQWLISQDFLKLTQALVDSQNRPLFLDPMMLDQPATIMGRKFNISNYCPNTFTTGQYVGMYFDPMYYLIADGPEFYIHRLDELFALNNQVGFIGYQETDGMPGIEEAFVRLITN